MFAVRDTRTGKFLRNFSGSYNSFRWHSSWMLKKRLKREPTYDEVHNDRWSLDTPNGAKLYKTRQGISTAFYSGRYVRDAAGRLSMRPLAQAMPWLEIVEVQVSVAER